jgi:predicted DNA-binding transcriptional regulator YafY
VIGFCHVRNEVRTFRVDRISEVTLLENSFVKPIDFDLQDYLQSEMQSQPQIVARLKFDAVSANIVSGNQSYWQSVEPQADGSVEVTLFSPTLEWAASTVLMYGPAVEVLEPPALRAMVAEWLEVTIQKYI